MTRSYDEKDKALREDNRWGVARVSDESAAFTEEPWRWIDEDGNTVTRSVAWSGPGCHEGCGVLMTVNPEGKLIKCEGDPNNPYNQGKLCMRCLGIPDVTYSEKRLKYPMKRDRKHRGDVTKFERITWEEAYDIIEAEMNRIKEDYGPEYTIWLGGTGRDHLAYTSRLAWSYGSPHWLPMLSGISCAIPRVALCIATLGTMVDSDFGQGFADRYDNPQWKAPETICVWGCNPLISNPDDFLGHWIPETMRDYGSKLIVVDPRVNWLSARADIFLQIRPGTDAAMAMAWLNVIINEDLYDHDFVEKWCHGFDELAERVADYTPEKVSEICFVPAEKIYEAARMYAKSNNANFRWGLAVDMTKESTGAAHAMQCIFAICGNIDVPGGMTCGTTYPFNTPAGSMWGWNLVPEEMQAKRAGVDRWPILNMGVTYAHPDKIIEMMETGQPNPIKGVAILQTNIAACIMADPDRTMPLFREVEFTFASDIFMTPTIVELADVVLPCTTFPERDGLRGDWFRAGIMNKVIEPVGDVRSDQLVSIELGKRFNPEAWPWATEQDMYSDMLYESGKSFAEWRECSDYYQTYTYKKYEKGLARADGEPGFMTVTGKVELYSPLLESMGIDPLPYYEEPTESPLSTPELFEEYPLVLTTGARDWASFHSEHRMIPRLRHYKKWPTVEVHPETAAKYGVSDGDWVWLENSQGRARRKVKVTEVVPTWLVACDHGWWLPEESAEENGNSFKFNDLNINHLVPALPGTSGFGANYKSLICKMYKVQEEEM